MDRATQEIEAVKEAVVEAAEAQLRELADLQLLLVGGGSADPLFM